MPRFRPGDLLDFGGLRGGSGVPGNLIHEGGRFFLETFEQGFATGTPAGVGFARKPPRFLRPGDVVQVEIEGLGTLTNPVIAEGGDA